MMIAALIAILKLNLLLRNENFGHLSRRAFGINFEKFSIPTQILVKIEPILRRENISNHFIKRYRSNAPPSLLPIPHSTSLSEAPSFRFEFE